MTGIHVTQTVTIIDAAVRRPAVGLGALGALALGAVVLAVAHSAGGLAMAWAIVGLLLVLTLTALAALIVYALKSPESAPVWEPLAPGVEVTEDRRVVGRRPCVTCPRAAVRVIRGPSGRALPVCSIHLSYAADYLRRALPVTA